MEPVHVYSEEYAKYIKKMKEAYLECLKKAREEHCAIGYVHENGGNFEANVSSDGCVYIHDPESDPDDPRGWLACYSSIDAFLMHHNGDTKDERHAYRNATLFLDALCNFDNQKEFFLCTFDGTGHRPGPFGPSGWHKGIIVCSSKQIQEIRRRIDQGEAFTEEMILEINPIAIYKTFAGYCVHHQQALFVTIEIETPTPKGWILNPKRPRWIAPEDIFKVDTLMQNFIDEEEGFKKFFNVTQEELAWIREGDYDKFINKRGIGYGNFCKRHGIPLQLPENYEKTKEKIARECREERERQEREAEERYKTFVKNYIAERVDPNKADPETLEALRAEACVNYIDPEKERPQREFEELLRKAYKIAEDDIKGVKKFFWGRDVFDEEYLKIYEEEEE